MKIPLQKTQIIDIGFATAAYYLMADITY